MAEEFRVGDEVEWDLGNERATARVVEVDRLSIFVERLTSSLGYLGKSHFDQPGTSLRLVRRATPEKARFYGTMPDVLPRELPYGTKWFNGRSHGTTGVVELEAPEKPSGPCYVGPFFLEDGERTTRDRCSPDYICWETVPLPASDDEAEPKVGEYCRGRTIPGSQYGPDAMVQGWLMGHGPVCSFLTFTQGSGSVDASVHRNTLVRIGAAPDEAEAKADPLFCCQCGVAVSRHETTATKDRDCYCGPCAAISRDPYKEHQEKLYGKTGERTGRFREWFDWNARQDSRHAAMLERHKKQYAADLDRKLPVRGKWDWDVDDTEDPRVT